MRYLKLFEAFESIKLSRIFSYLSVEGKNKFLEDLKLVSNYLDYPLSKLSDNDFQYLSYKRAWNLNNPEADKLEMIKFWFDKDGNYIGKTGINGSSIDIHANQIEEELYSDNIDDYIETSGDLSFSELSELQTGQLIYLRCSGGEGPAYLYRSLVNGEAYAFQNFANGSTPDDRGDHVINYREIARFSWVLASTDDYYVIRKLRYKKAKSDKDVLKNIFNLNIKIDNGVYTFYDSKIEKKSHFALILDLTKLSEISLNKLRKERVERKKGAFVTDEEIKSKNIERYLEEIFKTEKIISDPNRVIKRLLGGENILFFYMNMNIKAVLDDIKELYYNAVSNNNDKEVYISELKRIFYRFNNRYNERKNTILKNIKEIKIELNSNTRLGGEYENKDYLEYLNNLEDLSKDIYNKLSEVKIENIYDIEGLYNKMYTLSNKIFSDNKNYFSKSVNFLNHALANDKSTIKYYLTDSWENRGLVEFNETGYNRMKELIKRL